MSLDTIYILANILALSGWVALLLSAVIPVGTSCLLARTATVVLAVLYSVMMLSLLPFNGGGFDSVANLTNLFAQPEIALVGWVHYLAFDLFIGAWQVQTARRENLSYILVLPSLLLTMLLGPLGLLFFLFVRYTANDGREVTQPNAVDASNT